MRASKTTSAKLRQRVVAEAEAIDLDDIGNRASLDAVGHYLEPDAHRVEVPRPLRSDEVVGPLSSSPIQSSHPSYEDDVLDSLNVLRRRSGDEPMSKPRIAARRLGIQRAGGALQNVFMPSVVSQQPALFDNAGDDIIKFRRDDDDEGDAGADEAAQDTSTDSDVSETALSRRRRRKADRDFDNALEERRMAEEEEELYGSGDDSESTGFEEDDEETTSDEYMSESSDDDGSSRGDVADGAVSLATQARPPTSRGFGAGRHPHAAAAQQPTPPITSPLGRSHYSGVTFESHYNNTSGSSSSFGCYHTLLGLTTSQSIRGPCAIYGIYGEASCGGYLLGQKHFVLPTARDAVVLQPLQKLATAASQQTAAALQLQARQRCEAAAANSMLPDLEAPDAHADEAQDPSTMFGAVDWSWATNTLQSWLSRLAANKSMSVVLIVQRYVPGELMTRRVSFKKSTDHVDRYGTGDGMIIPGCFARRPLPLPIDAALMPVFRRILSSAQSVAVVGGQNIGKSTLCRALANGFFSQHGVCYWLDLDLGRPEFGVSGSFSISRIRRPLMRENDFEAAQWVKLLHVGGARMQCPDTMALAIAAVCDFVERHHGTWLRPMVINTHGWIHSTGRRSTVEVLRRLCPQHVIHMMRHGDPSWAVPEVLYDPRCGLNKRVVLDRFRGSIPTSMPEATGARNNLEPPPAVPTTSGGKRKVVEAAGSPAPKPQPQAQSSSMQIHALMVDREDVGARKQRQSRQDSWRYYFRRLQGLGPGNSTAACTSGSVLTLSLKPPQRCGAVTMPTGPLLVMPHDDLDVVDQQRFLCTIARSVVAFGRASCDGAPPLGWRGNRKRCRTVTSSVRANDDSDSDSASDITTIFQPQHVVPSAEFLGYGLVLSSWKEMQEHSHIRIAVPLPLRILQSMFSAVSSGDAEGGSSPSPSAAQRLFLLACPYEMVDTGFLIKQLVADGSK